MRGNDNDSKNAVFVVVFNFFPAWKCGLVCPLDLLNQIERLINNFRLKMQSDLHFHPCALLFDLCYFSTNCWANIYHIHVAFVGEETKM
jgi:hypothetical protein